MVVVNKMAYYIYGATWKKNDPSPEQIDKAIDELLPIQDDFVVLVNTEPINNCKYVQTLITSDNAPEINYQIETRFVYENHFSHYQIFIINEIEVKRMFRMFALGIIPNIDGWSNITADLMKKAGKK